MRVYCWWREIAWQRVVREKPLGPWSMCGALYYPDGTCARLHAYITGGGRARAQDPEWGEGDPSCLLLWTLQQAVQIGYGIWNTSQFIRSQSQKGNYFPSFTFKTCSVVAAHAQNCVPDFVVNYVSHVPKHSYCSLSTSLSRPFHFLEPDEVIWRCSWHSALRRCGNHNRAGAVMIDRDGSKHGKTRRWLDFLKCILLLSVCEQCLGHIHVPLVIWSSWELSFGSLCDMDH